MSKENLQNRNATAAQPQRKSKFCQFNKDQYGSTIVHDIRSLDNILQKDIIFVLVQDLHSLC